MKIDNQPAKLLVCDTCAEMILADAVVFSDPNSTDNIAFAPSTVPSLRSRSTPRVSGDSVTEKENSLEFSIVIIPRCVSLVKLVLPPPIPIILLASTLKLLPPPPTLPQTFPPPLPSHSECSLSSANILESTNEDDSSTNKLSFGQLPIMDPKGGFLSLLSLEII